MKRLSIPGILLALVLIFALAVPVQAAQVYRYNESIYLNDELLGFDFEGPLHVKIIATENNSGKFHLKVGVNSQGIKAIGPDGSRYNVIATVQGKLNSAEYLVTPPVNATLTVNLLLIGQGQAEDYRAHANIHIIMDENGELSTKVWNIVWTLPIEPHDPPF